MRKRVNEGSLGTYTNHSVLHSVPWPPTHHATATLESSQQQRQKESGHWNFILILVIQVQSEIP